MPPNTGVDHCIPTRALTDEWHVASLAVHTRPEALAPTERWLQTHDSAEIHARSEQGKLVVVVESREAQTILDLIDEAVEREGVLNAALVYHEVISAEEEAP